MVSVIDLNDGTYEVNAKYGLSGVYQLGVYLSLGDRRTERRAAVLGSPFTVYVGGQLTEKHLLRWLDGVPRTVPAASLAADAVSGKRRAGGISALIPFGVWQHDREALLAHSVRAWRLFVARQILSRFVQGTVPLGSPRVVTHAGVPVGARQQAHGRKRTQK